MRTIKRVAIYTRVSTNKEEQKLSLQIQGEYYQEYCQEKGYEQPDIYADEGLSGTSIRKRTKFRELMRDCALDFMRNDNGADIFNRSTDRKPKFDLIIVKDASRFARNVEQGVSTVKRLRDNNVEVLFENAGLSSFDEQADFVLPFLFSMAENESKGTGKKIAFTKKFVNKKGIYNPSMIPYGYKRDSENKVVVDKEKAEVVKHIFKRYLEVGTTILYRELNDAGVLSPSGKRWARYSINRIISNSIYYGSPTVNQYKRKNVTDVYATKLDKTEHVILENVVEPIVSKDIWLQAQRAMLDRTQTTSKGKGIGKKRSTDNPYYHKIYCGECGAYMNKHVSKKQKRINGITQDTVVISYICNTRRSHGTDKTKGGCSNRSVTSKVLNEALMLADTSLKLDEMNNTIDYAMLLQAIVDESKSINLKRSKLIAELNQLEEENSSQLDMLTSVFRNSNKTTIESIKKKIDEKSNQIDKINFQLSNLSEEELESFKQKVIAKKQQIADYKIRKDLTLEERQELLERVISNHAELELFYKTPDFKTEIQLFNDLFGSNLKTLVKQNMSGITLIKSTHKAHLKQ